jgi:hypothetical protein
MVKIYFIKDYLHLKKNKRYTVQDRLGAALNYQQFKLNHPELFK